MGIENLGYSMAISMILFLPSLFWDKFEAFIASVHYLNNAKLQIRGFLISAARRFRVYEQVGNRQSNNESMQMMEHSMLWDIPLISAEESANISMIDSSKDILLLNPLPTQLNKYLSIFFLIYLFVNNFGDVQLRLLQKPDGGNIGELLRIDQQWVMYGPDVDENVSFNLLTGHALIAYKDETMGKADIVLNDLLTSNWQKVTVFEGADKYKRPWNPMHLTPSMRWERLLVKASKKTDMRDSVLSWFCKHIKGKELVLRYQNHKKQYDDGLSIKEEYVTVEKMTHASWCTANGQIVNLWKQNTSLPMPQYQNEEIRCFHQIECP